MSDSASITVNIEDGANISGGSTSAAEITSTITQDTTISAVITSGAKGDKGDTGATGPTGATGLAASISVGSTTTGAAGTSASVTNSGTSSAAVFNFTIPKGADGTNGTNGQGVPTGGLLNQVLAKNSATDYDTKWIDPSATPDATTTSKGIVQLAGDLAGTAAAPTVPGLANKVNTTTTVNGHALSANVTVTKSDVSLGNVTNDVQLKATQLSTDNTLASNSDTLIPSQKATKAYVDNALTTMNSGVTYGWQ